MEYQFFKEEMTNCIYFFASIEAKYHVFVI